MMDSGLKVMFFIVKENLNSIPVMNKFEKF